MCPACLDFENTPYLVFALGARTHRLLRHVVYRFTQSGIHAFPALDWLLTLSGKGLPYRLGSDFWAVITRNVET